MELEDVCGASHGARLRLWLEQNHGKDYIKKINMTDLMFAEQQVNAEMLNEVHFMLRHLCGIKEK